MPKRVLIAIDWSPNAEKAFDYYVYHVHRRDCLLILSHYIEAGKPKELMKKEQELLELQEIYENRLLQLKINYEWITGTGSAPGDHIVGMALERQCEMIIMGARGLGKIKKALLGSVSDYVLKKAHCPVLVCKWSE